MGDASGQEAVKKQRFEQWVRQYSQSVLRTCFIYLADKSMAEDAMQDTFLKAWKAMEQFERRNDAGEKPGLCALPSMSAVITTAPDGFVMWIWERRWRNCLAGIWPLRRRTKR